MSAVLGALVEKLQCSGSVCLQLPWLCKAFAAIHHLMTKALLQYNSIISWPKHCCNTFPSSHGQRICCNTIPSSHGQSICCNTIPSFHGQRNGVKEGVKASTLTFSSHSPSSCSCCYCSYCCCCCCC